MKVQPLRLIGGNYQPCLPAEATHLKLKFPVAFAPMRERILPVQISGPRDGTPNWSWNGSVDAPTLRPSVLTRWTAGDGEWHPGSDRVCHSFVNDGKVQFLGDCTHELAGQTLELIDF